MEYIGLQSQLRRNNTKSILLLIAFPALLLSLVWAGIFFSYGGGSGYYDMQAINYDFFLLLSFVIAIVGIWFFIAWLSHSSMIRRATSSKPLERKENMRVYNLVENICMSIGMKTPKIYIMEDDSLNAFASGISTNTFAVSLSRGIINKLNDEELKGVIAHELTHIRNGDVKLLIISIIFVGIFSFIAQAAFRVIIHGRVRSKNNKAGGIILIFLILGIIGYLLSLLFRFALSRKREYMADAGAVELTKNSDALANALKKITEDPFIEAVKREDVAQLFIEHPKKKKKSFFSSFSGLFATHPPIDKRIELLEQF